MPDFDRTPGSEPSLDDIRRSDSFIEALAAGAPVTPADQADAALAALLGTWRDESRQPSDAGLISEPQAIAALDAGLAEKRTGINRDKRIPTAGPAKRNRRGLSVVGAAAAAMLCIGGFGAVVSGAGPGDSLYGLRTMLFGAPKQVRDDQVALAARTEMQQVQELISRGDWQQAEEKLVAVSNQVSSIGDVEQKQQLLDQFNDLSAKVVERDPEATAPPGITYTVPPSATELVPATVPPTSASTSAPAEGSATNPESASPSAASTTPTSVPASPSSTSAAASTSAPATTSAAATSATQQSQVTTTPTSATPTSATPTTTAAPATTSTTAPAAAATTATSTTTTTAPAAAATTTTSTTAPAAAATSSAPTSTAPATSTQTAASTPAAASAPAATSTSAPAAGGAKSTAGAVGTSAPPVVTPTTTTVVVPLPVPAG